MNGLLTLSALIIFTAVIIFLPEFGASAVIFAVFFAAIAGLLINRLREHSVFLLRLFVAALLVRIVIGTIIFYFNLQDFFGGDAVTYDYFGNQLLKIWAGENSSRHMIELYYVGGGWGMLYLVASVYALVGRNPLAVQFINAVIGAATAPLLFACTMQIFNNARVARIAALFAAFYPSLVLWSSQGLKDGPIVFLLVLIMLAALKLGKQLSFKYIVILACGMFAILSLRFYIFYMVVVAIGGSLLIGMRQLTTQSVLRQFVTIIALGLALTYFGVLRIANTQIDRYGSLQRVQNSRLDQRETATSGFAKDVDVSTTSGAISAVPVGLLYLLFAPFPWQLANLRQSITLPEMLVWWGAFPLLMLGLWFTIKFRLRQALPILIFTFMLTLSYSVFQGNVGTAYRQRAQLLVFYFIFVGVGYVLLKERLEHKQQRAAMKQALNRRIASKGEWQ